MTLIKHLLLAPLLLVAGSLLAAGNEDLIRPIQSQWAEIKYRQPEKQQAELYRALAQQARQVSASHPNAAEALIWEAIVVSSEAGARGGLGALSLAKESKRLLEESLKLDEKALNGSAYTSLATLYAKVPFWPIAFGDKKLAEELFRKSLAVNPQGIDPNYLYGEYLVDQNRLTEARTFLDAALKAPPRPGRELADSGRRQEVLALLNRIAKDAK